MCTFVSVDRPKADSRRATICFTEKTVTAAHALKTYIDENNGNVGLCAADIAGRLEVSTRELRRAFCSLFQASPREYQCQVRMAHAKSELRKQPSVSIDDLSKQLGYSERGDFAKFFKKHVGMTPAEYRSARDEQSNCK